MSALSGPTPQLERTMKTTMLAAVAVLWVGAAIAQAPQTPPAGGPGPGFQHETPAQRLDNLATLLDLTDEQKAQVQTVLEEEHSKMEAFRQQFHASGQKPTFEQMKTEHEQLQQDTIAKLTPVLTPGQLKKFQVLMEHGPHGH
jgi:Spy/CpxP family protein refolding chaperone